MSVGLFTIAALHSTVEEATFVEANFNEPSGYSAKELLNNGLLMDTSITPRYSAISDHSLLKGTGQVPIVAATAWRLLS